MKSALISRLPGLGLAALLLIPAPSPAADATLEQLVGRWSPPAGQSVDQASDGGLVAEGRWVLEDSWLELDLTLTGDDGRLTTGERILLRQAADGGVVAFAFAAGRELPLRLEGRWSSDQALELAAGEGGAGLTWRRESPCEARLVRNGEHLLVSAACGAGDQVAETSDAAPRVSADGRPVGATPDAIPGSDPVRVSELPASRPPATSSEAQIDLVIVAGNGEPYDEVKKAVERLTDFFAAKGVRVTGPSDEIVVLQTAGSSLTYLVQQARDRRAASLLYVTAAFGGRERVIVDCYNRDGARIWREKVVGGTAMRKFRWMNPKLMERIEAKLEPRIGGPGLPLADAP